MDNTTENISIIQLQADVAELRYKVLQKELSDKEKTENNKSFLNPINTSILIALLGILGAIITNIVQQNANIKVEERKLKSSLVLKALDAGDTAKIAKMLLFFINNKLIDDKDGTIRKAAVNSNELPSPSFFNTPAEMKTITIASNKNPCKSGPIDGCWKDSISGEPGDTIAVQIFYKNTSFAQSRETTLSIQPSRIGTGDKIIFYGGVASLTGPRSVGQAILYIPSKNLLTYVPGSARLYSQADVFVRVNEGNLLGVSGLNIGNVQPGVQGTLVANFTISQK